MNDTVVSTPANERPNRETPIGNPSYFLKLVPRPANGAFRISLENYVTVAANKLDNATDRRSIIGNLAPRPDKPRSFYVPQLDALRFLAFLLVFLSHGLNPDTYVGQFSPSMIGLMNLIRDTCGYGLCLFFFLSSFLITSLLYIERSNTGDINLSKFYIRRILRIWPLYFLYIGAIALVGLRLKTWHISVPRLIAMSLLAGNWYAIVAAMGNSAISVLWSISVEEQFYAIWPSVFRVLKGPKFVIFAGAACVTSLVATFLIASRYTKSLPVWLNSLPQGLFSLLVLYWRDCRLSALGA